MSTNTKILLTNEDFIRSAGNLDDNIQSKFLLPAIRETQEIDLQSIIGQNLYESLLNKISEDEIDEPQNQYYKELLDRAQYFILYSVLSKIVIISTFKINNIGAYTTNDENAYNVGKDAFELQDYYQKKADWYARRIQEYIMDNINAFQELNKSTYFKINKNLYSSASSSIYLGGARGKVCKGGIGGIKARCHYK